MNELLTFPAYSATYKSLDAEGSQNVLLMLINRIVYIISLAVS